MLLKLTNADRPEVFNRLDEPCQKAVRDFRKMITDIHSAKIRYTSKDRVRRRINELQQELSDLKDELQSLEDDD